MTLIILDANECNFKTTIAHKLHDKLGYEVTRGSSFELSQCTNNELHQRFLEFAQLDNVILDRFIYSNLVYASLYADYSILTQEQVDEIEEIIKDNSIVVYLKAPTDTIKERIAIRGDLYVSEDKVESINEKYKEVMSKVSGKINLLQLDTSILTSDQCVDEILCHLNKQ